MRGQAAPLKDYLDVPLKKPEFLTGSFKNLGWEIDFGYPIEGGIDDCYAEIRVKLLRVHIQELI
ncbi:hypothetical protein IGK61_003420 [Enterococcus sp. AZ063]